MIQNLASVVILVLGISKNSNCETEHKVHNIVLYPEKHSWCQTTPIQQVIGSPGYESVTIDNNVCVGACYSYSIPKTQPAEPGELIGPYCDSCQPANIECYHVNLIADKTNEETPPILQKRVQIITNCSCQTCGKVRKEDCEITDENTLELPRNLYTGQEGNKSITEEKPELFEAQNSTHNTKNSESDVLLKNKLKHWFENYKIDDAEEQVEDDGNDARNNRYIDINQEINAKIEQDLKNMPKNFGIEGAPSHQKGVHIAAGIHTVNEITETAERKHHSHHNRHNGHHHIGEEQTIGNSVAHLIRGPHSSMVLTPGETKLQIDSDSLKPNNEGVVIEYENHHKSRELLDN